MSFSLDFELILTLATLITGLAWLLGVLFFRKRNAEGKNHPIYAFGKYFFPVLLIVLLLRSFLFEPFRIPSGSMMPTLEIGDLILVNKYIYGIRMPAIHTKILPVALPERGDIVVFRYPIDPKFDYIKRVVGLPGDSLDYRDKTLYINGEKVPQQVLGIYEGRGLNAAMSGDQILEEFLPNQPHEVLHAFRDQLFRGNFERNVVVPEGHYFVMGDNRDNSTDSRFWGFVPEENLVGKAVLIWFHWDWDGLYFNPGRIGTILHK